MSKPPGDETPIDASALIDDIPEEIRTHLSDEDIQLLSQAGSLMEFRKMLMEVMKKLPNEFAPSMEHFEQMMQKFYRGMKEEDRRMLTDMFARLRQSMVNLMQGGGTAPLMTPKTPGIAQQKKSDKDTKGR